MAVKAIISSCMARAQAALASPLSWSNQVVIASPLIRARCRRSDAPGDQRLVNPLQEDEQFFGPRCVQGLGPGIRSGQ